MDLRLGKWGNSKGVLLNNKLIKQLGWGKVSVLEAEIVEENKLLLSIGKGQDDGSLEFLFEGYTKSEINEPRSSLVGVIGGRV